MNLELKDTVKVKDRSPSCVTGLGAEQSAATFLGDGFAPWLVKRNPCHSISVSPRNVLFGSNVKRQASCAVRTFSHSKYNSSKVSAPIKISSRLWHVCSQ